jgi:2-polyprenyl-3-methyl-5-hydroxy-6-metoxy-1,4-benzoquinol methylase
VLNHQKLTYLLRSAQKRLRGEGSQCPSCGSGRSAVVARKYLITELRRCESCRLLYRAPTTTKDENAAFYQEEYSQGFTTSVPSRPELDDLLRRGFRGTEKDYSPYVAVLNALGVGPGARLLDFGCSWGYGSWQLQRAGFRVTSFEISRPRCKFARDNLGLDAHAELGEISGPFDVVFSAHVLEHVPVVSEAIAVGRRLLRNGGWFVAFTPNGSHSLRLRRPAEWMSLWGQVHPNFLDPEFYRHTFGRGLLLASAPYDLDAIKRWSGAEACELDLGGDELLVVARFAQPAS